MMNPKALRKGDRVALIAPSGPQPDDTREAAIQSVRALGLEPVASPSCHAKHGYLAGEDAIRAGDVQAAFADDSIRGILCIRGGYGAHRLIPRLDFAEIHRHPKRLLGYSDITALHLQLSQQCDMISWHTPMPGTEWHKGLDAYTMTGIERALFDDDIAGMIHNPPGATSMETLSPGVAEGRLTGGNLSLIAATLGTPYEIDTRGKILFIEDVDEEPYTLDRMLTQLGHAGKLSDAAGILIGPFTNCEGKKEKACLSVERILQELVIPAGRPVLSGLQCGHITPSASLPIGALARMDTGAKTLEILGA